MTAAFLPCFEDEKWRVMSGEWRVGGKQVPHARTAFGMTGRFFGKTLGFCGHGTRSAAPQRGKRNPRAQAGAPVLLEGVDGVADYNAVDVGYVYAAVGGGVFEDLRF